MRGVSGTFTFSTPNFAVSNERNTRTAQSGAAGDIRRVYFAVDRSRHSATGARPLAADRFACRYAPGMQCSGSENGVPLAAPPSAVGLRLWTSYTAAPYSKKRDR